MKTLKFNKYNVTLLHLLFWIVSFNLFNAFFSRGIESGYVLDDFELTTGDMLLISNITMIVILTPFIWFFKPIKVWIKWSITIGIFLAVAWAIVISIMPKGENLIVPIILLFFLDNFLYVFIFHITIIAAVYVNARILIRKYLSQGRFLIYLSAVLILAIISGLINYALFNMVVDKIFPQLFYISWFKVWELILIITGYIAITTAAFLLWQYSRVLITNQEKARNELSALKAQINPHFLFNNLNTIYALAEKGDPRTKAVILQLSDFLRYVLYDTSSEKIDLEKEVEIIKTYIELQKERITKNTTEVIFNTKGDYTGAQIAPLLLLPLAENCFKHGVGRSHGKIEIDILYSGNELHFSTKNSIERRENPLNQEEGGIGILNVEKRLNLLYPNKHRLSFTDEGDFFKVEMTIGLD
ncbi:MAG: histidine kinase [Mariniphaga sp.]